MIIDCAQCPARGVACGGCVIDLFVGRNISATATAEILTAEERRAVAVLVSAGLVDWPAGSVTEVAAPRLAG